MQSSDNQSDSPSKQKLAFRYEYFLDKHEFREWSEHLNSMTPATRMSYLTHEHQTLQRAEPRNKTVCNLRIVLFVNVLLEELTSLVKSYNSMLGIATPEQLAAIEQSLYLLTQYYQHLETLDDFKLSLACDKTIIKRLLDKFDEAFLYTNNMRLLLQIARCFRSNEGKVKASHYNFVGLDLSLPDNYYCAKLEALYKKYERYFSCKEVPTLSVKRSSSSKDEMKPLGMKKSSSRDEKHYELQGLTLQELLEQRSINKISQHLEREYMSQEDKIALLLSLKSMSLKQQFAQQPSLRTSFLMLHYSFVRSDVLEESELALPQERQVYEDLLVKMIPSLATDEGLLELFLQSEPVCFLERPYQRKRTEVGQIELFVAQQIELIEKAFADRIIPAGLVVPLLKKDNLLHFVGLVLGFVYSFDSIFSSTNDVAIYKMYVKMLDFIKRCYLSFANNHWNYPLELMVAVGSDTFKQFHMDIEQDIKELTKKLIQRYNHGKLPTWLTFEDGEFKECPTSKLECFQAIKFYLKDCSEMENNFLEFDQAVPTDVQSSMLMIELVRIRFHDLEPNEQQKEFYKIVLEECMRHNVNPRFRWFNGFDYKVNAIRRSDEFQLERQVKNPVYRNLIRQIINLREVDYCNKAINDHNINDLVESLKFARGFKLEQTEVRLGRDEMVLFETLEIMSSLLCHPIELVDPPPENEIISQHLHMLLGVYNQRQRVCFDSRQYEQIFYGVLLKFLDTPFSLTKPFYEKYSNFFQDFLYITKLVEIADRIIELMERNVETRDGLLVKLNFLHQVIVRRNKEDRENRAIMVDNLAEITIKFMSILSPSLNADVYMNLAVILWRVHKIMGEKERFAFNVVFDPVILSKMDVWRHYKAKVINDNEFLSDLASYIVNVEPLADWESLSENNVVKLIEHLHRLDVAFNIETLSERYHQSDLDTISSGKLLLVVYQLTKDNVYNPLQSEVLNRVAASLSKRKPRFNVIEPNLSKNALAILKQDGVTEELSKMVKAGGDKNVEIWLDFISMWKTEQDVYSFAITLPATLNQIKKVVNLKTVLRLGCDAEQTQAYLKSLLPLVGVEGIHLICQAIVAEIAAEQDKKDEYNKQKKPSTTDATYLFLILELAAKSSTAIQNFLIKNFADIDRLGALPIKDEQLKKQIQKAYVHFVKILVAQYKWALGSLKCNLLKLDASERAIYKEKIDYAYRLVSYLPRISFNLCKEAQKKQDEQNWESEEEQKQESSEGSQQEEKIPEEKEAPKKKKGSKPKSEGEESAHEGSNDAHSEASAESDNNSDEDDDDGDGDEEIDKDQITEILLEMRAGYKEYLEYLSVREELDILIRGDYEQLEKDFTEKHLSKQVEDLLRGIMKLLEVLGTASKRILEKMNPNILNIMKGMGLPAAADVQPAKEEQVATKIKTFDKYYSESEFNDDNDDDDENDEEMDATESEEERESEFISEGEHIPQANSHQQEEDQIEEEDEEEKEPEEEQTHQPNEQNEQELVLPHMSIQEVLGQLFGGGVHPKRKHHHARSEGFPTAEESEEGSLNNLFELAAPNQKFLLEEQFEKTIELALYKMFDADDLVSMVELHRSLIHSKFCCSIYANSIFMMLRIKEQPENCLQLKDYPMLSRDYEDTQSSLTMYDRFLTNACKSLEGQEPPSYYTELDPPIQSVQTLADRLKLLPQPNLITLALVLMTNQEVESFDDDVVEDIVRHFKLQDPEESEQQKKEKESTSRMKIRSKHIETLLRSAYRYEFLPHNQSQFLDMFTDLNAKKMLRIFMEVVFAELGKSTYEMHKKIEQLQKDIISDAENNRDNRGDLTNILNDLTRTYFKRFDIFYYSFKHLLKVNDELEESEQVKAAIYDKINGNEILNRVVAVALHHINFYLKYLQVPDKPLPKSLNELILNEMVLVNIPFLVFSNFNKTIELEAGAKIMSYLDANLVKPVNCPYKTLDKTISLVLPLLNLDFLCVPKYQRILLPPIFDKPERGYQMPTSFRLIELNGDQDDTQMLEIRRGCSFDLALYQLRRTHFRIEYHKEEGNDQGGLRRQFMLGWQGFGVGEEAAFIGKILAIAFRDNMLYGGRFDISMALALTGYKLDVQFLRSDDPEMFNSISYMLNNPAAELEQDFTHIRKYYDVEIKVDLKPDGSKIPVTDANKLEYVELLLQDKYFGGRKKEMEELRRGFFSIVPEKCVRILTPNELLDRISGVDTFNVEQLKKNVTYEGYSSTSEIIQWFWQEVTSFDFKERQTFLHFLTGTYKLPHGLKNYSFTIERVYDTNRLPVAHTCFNTLDLPEYTTYTVFREKFRTAVFEGNDNYGIM